MQIGKIKINNPVMLAPMAGVSDYPYRQIVRKMGCELLYTEMVSSKGLVYGNKKTETLIDYTTTKSGFIGVQIFGEEPEYMAKAAKLVQDKYHPDLIDINMGCPTPKIVKNGSGSALLKNPQLAGELISAVVNAVKIPVTIKLRKGWDREHINAIEMAMLAEEKGASAVAVHGRTREEFYSGQADWKVIKEVKQNIGIPVIGNGDIFSPEDAAEMINYTNCDGVMIGRGAQGNPWLIRRVSYYLQTGELLPEPSYEERIKIALEHYNLAIHYFGLEFAIPKMRKHLSWYLKGMPFSAAIKEKIIRLNDYQDIKTSLESYLKTLHLNHL